MLALKNEFHWAKSENTAKHRQWADATPLKAAPSHFIRRLFTKRTCFFLFPLPFQHFPFDCCHCDRSRTNRLQAARTQQQIILQTSLTRRKLDAQNQPARPPSFPAAVHARKSQRSQPETPLLRDAPKPPSGSRNTLRLQAYICIRHRQPNRIDLFVRACSLMEDICLNCLPFGTGVVRE